MEFDTVILGTGLAESIVAAALSKAGYKVAHIDANPCYGGDNASLNVDELLQWAEDRASPVDPSSSNSYLSAQRNRFKSVSYSNFLPPSSRRFSVSLSPSIIPSVGPLIDSLIASGVSRYGGFKLLDRVAVYVGLGVVKTVPGSKEDVFKSKELSLVDKRRLMRFLMFAASNFEDKPELQGHEQTPFLTFLHDIFSLDEKLSEPTAYALAFCVSASDPTLPALQRIRRYLRSAGRYGASPFLVGHYGGIGEIAQGFCRTSAVHGGTYVLGHLISSVTSLDHRLSRELVQAPIPTSSHRRWEIELESLQEHMYCDVIISAPDYIPSHVSSSSKLFVETSPTSLSIVESIYPVVRCIAIIDRPISFSVSPPSKDYMSTSTSEAPAEDPLANDYADTALLIFPPGSVQAGSSTTAVSVLITGEGTMSAPRGYWILNFCLPLLSDDNTQTAEELLKPYLDATLTLASRPLGSGTESGQSLFTLFYKESPSTPSVPHAIDTAPGILRIPDSARSLSEIADSATSNAEAMFWKAVNTLKTFGLKPERQKSADEDLVGGSEDGAIHSFWPPLDDLRDDGDEEW